MYFIRIQFLIISFALLMTSCIGVGPSPYGQPPYGQPPYGQNPYGQQYLYSTGPYSPPRNDYEYDRRKAEDRDRNDVLSSSRSRNRGDTCEDRDRDHDCKKYCRSMYRRSRDRDDCEELTVRQIEKLFDVYEILKEADEDDLGDINQEDFEVYLNVSIAGFDYLVGRYNRGEAKDVLRWIVEDEKVTSILRKEDDDYETLEELFEIFSGDLADNMLYEPFTRNIEGSNTLMDVVMDSDNEKAAEWFQEYLIEEDTNCTNDESAACFTLFCKIGKEMDKRSREEWLDYGDFEDLINTMISLGIGGKSNPGNTDKEWNTDDIQDVSDIPNDDFLNLCKKLLNP